MSDQQKPKGRGRAVGRGTPSPRGPGSQQNKANMEYIDVVRLPIKKEENGKNEEEFQLNNNAFPPLPGNESVGAQDFSDAVDAVECKDASYSSRLENNLTNGHATPCKEKDQGLLIGENTGSQRHQKPKERKDQGRPTDTQALTNGHQKPKKEKDQGPPTNTQALTKGHQKPKEGKDQGPPKNPRALTNGHQKPKEEKDQGPPTKAQALTKGHLKKKEKKDQGTQTDSTAQSKGHEKPKEEKNQGHQSKAKPPTKGYLRQKVEKNQGTSTNSTAQSKGYLKQKEEKGQGTPTNSTAQSKGHLKQTEEKDQGTQTNSTDQSKELEKPKEEKDQGHQSKTKPSTKDREMREEKQPSLSINTTVEAFDVSQSKLSPYAKEFVPQYQMDPNASSFVPSSYPSEGESYPSECEPEAEPNEEPGAGSGAEQAGSVEEKTWEDYLMDYNDTMNFCFTKLHEQPAIFDQLMDIVLHHFSDYVQFPELRQRMIQDLFGHAVSAGGFPYQSVKMLLILIQLSTSLEYDFRSEVLRFTRNEMLTAQETVKRNGEMNCTLRNFLMFTSEIYVQLLIGDGRLVPIGKSIADTIVVMLNSDSVPVQEKFSVTVMILKLVGVFLDADDRSILDSLFVVLQERLESEKEQNNIDESTVLLVEDLIARRNNNWNQQPMEELFVELEVMVEGQGQLYPDQVPVVYPEPMQYPVFYGPDGIALEREEQLFLEQAVGPEEELSSPEDNQMTAEMMECYDEFLEMQAQPGYGEGSDEEPGFYLPDPESRQY